MPTHGDQPTLPVAVRSALAQTERDFELIVSGDGVGDRTREVVRALVLEDARVRFDDFPKGEQRGERNRGRSVASSRGTFVAYLPDDDLWMPQHLAVLGDALEEVDFAHTMLISAAPDGSTVTDIFDASLFPDARSLRHDLMGIRNCQAGHRRDAYDALPHGWRLSAPCSADTYMWLQFIESRATRYRSIKRITALKLAAVPRSRMPVEERIAEIAGWLDCISDPARREELIARVLAEMLERDRRASRRALERLNVTRLAALSGAVVPPPTFAELDPWQERGNALPEPILRPGDDFTFDRFGDARLYAIGGFHEPEGWGCWIDGERADLVVPVACDTEAVLALEIVYRGLIVPPVQSCVRFDVIVNDCRGPSLTAQSGSEETAIVELSEAWGWRRRGFLAIRFVVHSSIRPIDHEISADTRRLGIGLVSVALVPSPAPPQSELEYE